MILMSLAASVPRVNWPAVLFLSLHVHLNNLSQVWLSDLKGNEQAPWASPPAGNQSLRLCRGELHAEESVAPIGFGPLEGSGDRAGRRPGLGLARLGQARPRPSRGQAEARPSKLTTATRVQTSERPKPSEAEAGPSQAELGRAGLVVSLREYKVKFRGPEPEVVSAGHFLGSLATS